ncbi:MAG TPA: bifunctional ADP-heptose synthase [Candidatus Limnocylindrales bacterium]|nr:bifunctional ADP-heptose synthase [Candidatus Limnocylindrales bacterium]
MKKAPPAPIPSRESLLDLVDRFRRRKVAVIGDLVLDEYWVGRSSRISREAPVLILEHEEDRGLPGGAANAAMNVRALGGAPLVVGRVGGDPAGASLARALRQSGLSTAWLHKDGRGGTIVKTRILAGSSHAARQQIVRLDRGHTEPLSRAAERKLMSAARKAVRGADAVLLSDYGYGVLSRAMRRAAIADARRGKVPIVVDSRYDLASYRGATLLTPNEHEVQDAMHLPSLRASALKRAGDSLVNDGGARAVWITRGSDGMLLFERGGLSLNVSIVGSSDVADVTGAGDAVSATAALALSVGASQLAAAILATYAASVVVMKRGTATVSREELRSAIRAHPLPKVSG